jgi:hypothetical protein
MVQPILNVFTVLPIAIAQHRAIGVTNTPYPIIDNAAIASAYQISYFPTIYTICPTGIVTETSQITAADHYAFIEAGACQTLPENDGMLFNYSGTELTCDDAEIIIDIVNLGFYSFNICEYYGYGCRSNYRFQLDR